MAKRTVAAALAGMLLARENCTRTGNAEWLAKHRERAEEMVADCLPSGSGWDNGTTLDFDASTPEKLVFHGSYHHMTDGGYDGWTDHTITVRASLAMGIEVTISGRNRNDIKDYLGDIFHEALSAEEPAREPSAV